MQGLVIKLNDKGEPTSVELDGRPIFVSTLDVQYRPNEPAKIIMEMFVMDAGGMVVRHGEEPLMEGMTMYAVSKEDFDFLQDINRNK
jgi:hypothetical protein